MVLEAAIQQKVANAGEKRRFVRWFYNSASHRAGIPIEPEEQGSMTVEHKHSGLPEKVLEKREVIKEGASMLSKVAPYVLAGGLGLGGLGLGTWLNSGDTQTPTPTPAPSPSPSVVVEKDGSLLQYLEDNGYHHE